MKIAAVVLALALPLQALPRILRRTLETAQKQPRSCAAFAGS